MDTSSLLNGLPWLNEINYLLYYQPRIYLSKTKEVSIVHYVYTNICINVMVTLIKSKPKHQRVNQFSINVLHFPSSTLLSTEIKPLLEKNALNEVQMVIHQIQQRLQQVKNMFNHTDLPTKTSDMFA